MRSSLQLHFTNANSECAQYWIWVMLIFATLPIEIRATAHTHEVITIDGRPAPKNDYSFTKWSLSGNTFGDHFLFSSTKPQTHFTWIIIEFKPNEVLNWHNALDAEIARERGRDAINIYSNTGVDVIWRVCLFYLADSKANTQNHVHKRMKTNRRIKRIWVNTRNDLVTAMINGEYSLNWCFFSMCASASE